MDVFTWIFGLLIPVVMVVAGLLMWKKPPREINSLVGFRTSRSVKNKQTWEFAHHHAGRTWTTCGSIVLGGSVLAIKFIPAPTDYILIVLCLFQLAVLIISIFLTQAALKRNFDKFGLLKGKDE